MTSPPFLDVVDYAGDNWLRCWFCGIDPVAVQADDAEKDRGLDVAMTEVFTELARVLKPGGHVAFEVGEVRGGRVRLEEHVVPCGIGAGLEPRAGADQRAAVHEDRGLLGRRQQPQGHEHQSHRAVPKAVTRYTLSRAIQIALSNSIMKPYPVTWSL